MGGKPYGRPLPMTGEDIRDGLSLDEHRLPLGPFLPLLPSGLKLDLMLQGDVIQSARVLQPPLPQDHSDLRSSPLRIVARQLRCLGLKAQATRFFRAARAARHGAAIDMRALQRYLKWSGAAFALPHCSGRAQEEVDIPTLLRGHEWHEAMLLLNGLGPDDLRRICPEARTEGSGGK